MDSTKVVLFTFLGNFHYDSRVTNFYNSFIEKGYKVKVISFDWLTKEFKTEKGDISVYRLTKNFSSIYYYLKFSIILSFRLLFTKADLIFAEDVYTLPFVILFAKLKKAKICYDSREIYAHLAGLSNKKNIQMFWRWIEKTFIKSVDVVITTGEMDSAYLEKEYNLRATIVIRNLPLANKIIESFDYRKKYNLENDKKILLYQGVILPGRGLNNIFNIMDQLENCVLIILGDGEYEEKCRQIVREKKLTNKVFFFGKVTQNELLKYTSGADIGLALIENLSLSYYYALPNKMFEYIYCGLPVIASNLPQMKAVIEKYNVGLCVNSEDSSEIKSVINMVASDDKYRKKLSANCKVASHELNWNNEIKKLFRVFETNT
ncbi:MAG: glycosyltransferase family 4 protein [Ignavibacteria bacterium]|nr:glycosyltransferase family 4 protein [Ignavibacteria bacterium]